MNFINLIIKLFFELILYLFGLRTYENAIINVLKYISQYNIIFVKIFQWAWINNNNSDNSNNSCQTQKIEDVLYSYTNNTPYDYTDIDYKNLLDIYIEANKRGDVFEIVDTKPINSGSISLIFKAKLNSKDIVVKMLRTNIKEKLNDGLNLLIKIENLLYDFSHLFGYDIMSTKMFEKNKSNILNQINFLNETENLSIFYKNFKKTKYVETPFVYPEYTKIIPNIILMDEIKGKYLYELSELEAGNYIMSFFKFVMDSIFIKNIFHCDLHQGNILFYSEKSNDGEKTLYKVGIIDMGMITPMSINEVNFLYMWMSGLFNDKFVDFIDYVKSEYPNENFFENNNNYIDSLLNDESNDNHVAIF